MLVQISDFGHFPDFVRAKNIEKIKVKTSLHVVKTIDTCRYTGMLSFCAQRTKAKKS
jgi:hypothetical protein